MLDIIKVVDRFIPLWEMIVIVLALFLIVVVLVLWWAFGYNLIVVPEAAQPASLVASLL
jgi:hypothetical protein